MALEFITQKDLPNDKHLQDDNYSHSCLSMSSQSSRYEPPLYKEDENQDRGNWSGRFDFLLSMLGWSVGLGNVWRFPYLCYENGGGVFLIPYFITLIVIGIPFFYLEVNLGQFSSEGTLTCWQFSPLFKGVGVAMCTLSAIVTVYYNVLVMYSLYYMFASFTSKLPWTDCNNWWNTKTCSLKLPLVNCTYKPYRMFPNGTCFNKTSMVGIWNATVFKNVTKLPRMSPSEEYFNFRVLKMSKGLHDLGAVQWELCLVLILAWIICFLCLVKGVKTTGKVVYFTALFPYVVLVILFIKGLTLDGAGIGIRFYITPVWHKLLYSKVWRDAATQVFYSMGMGWGGLIALASYNRFHNNTLRDSLIVPICGSLTSFFAGFVIFSYLGYMAQWMKVGIEDVAADGPGLAFIVYPEAITHLPPSQFWSFMFFFMLLMLGLDSQFVTVETILTGICDQFPKVRPKKSFIVLGICVIEFLLGLPFVTRGGMYVLHLTNTYVGMMALPVICLFEAIGLTYVYGCGRFCKDIQVMTGVYPALFFKVTWMFVGPLLIMAILVFSWISYSRLRYGSYLFPIYAEVIGWILAILPIIALIIYVIYKVARERDGDNVLERIKLLLMPSRMWGPYLVEHRRLVTHVPGFVLDPWTERQILKQKCYTNLAFTSSSASVFDGRKSLTSSKVSMSPVAFESNV